MYFFDRFSSISVLFKLYICFLLFEIRPLQLYVNQKRGVLQKIYRYILISIIFWTKIIENFAYISIANSEIYMLFSKWTLFAPKYSGVGQIFAKQMCIFFLKDFHSFLKKETQFVHTFFLYCKHQKGTPLNSLLKRVSTLYIFS